MCVLNALFFVGEKTIPLYNNMYIHTYVYIHIYDIRWSNSEANYILLVNNCTGTVIVFLTIYVFIQEFSRGNHLG